MLLTALLLSVPAALSEAAPTGGETGATLTEYLLRDLPGVPDEVRAAILAGDAPRALALVRASADHDAEHATFWLLLEAAVLQQDGAHADALTMLARAEERAEAQDPWRHKLRFARAASHRALGQWREAEAVLEEETARLRSADRLSELAAVVLAFADASSTPDAGAPPGAPATDYARALALYREVLAMEVLPETREYSQWRVAHCFAELSDWGSAGTASAEWLSAWDPSFETASRSAEPPPDRVPERVFDVRLHHARALARGGQQRAAERVALDLEAALDAYLGGGGALAGRLPRPSRERSARLAEMRGEALHLAAEAAGAAAGARPGAAPEDVIGVGPSAAQVAEEEARLRIRAQYRSAEALFALGRYEEAARAFEAYAAEHPTGADWSAAQQGVVRAAYEQGADLMRSRRWADARAAWTRFLERHPLHAAARGTFFAIGELFVLEAEGQDPAAAAPLLQSAIAQWLDLHSRWPQTEEASHALFASADLLESRLGRLEDAISIYRRCGFGSWAGPAQARLARMLEEDLSIATPRAWRSGETARVRVDLRNLEELEIEIHPLDLGAYFRKQLTHAGVPDLDLDLIAPERTFAWKVPDYRPHAPLTREIELPLEGHGAWAVAIRGSDLRATTLVLRTDLDLLVKSSREELIVLAADMRRGHAAEGVRVLVAAPGAGADGSPRVFELLTGADGVARLDWKSHGMMAPDDVRVHAAAEELGATGTQLGLEGLGTSAGLGARGHLSTDRPAYRPGETVHWRAVVRGVAADRWAFQPGEKWRVTISDPAGRPLLVTAAALSAFGTLEGSFALEPRAVTGGYQVRVAAVDGVSHAAGFQVVQFELPRVRLRVELDRTVAFRGERIAGRLFATSWFDEPLADAPLRLELPDGRALELRTGAAGDTDFRFDSAGAEEEAWLEFVVRHAESGVAAVARCFLAPTAFRAELRLRRAAVLVGESFPIEVLARDWSDAPVAAELRLTVVRRERLAGLAGPTLEVPDTWQERVVLERTLRTDAVSGAASLTLALEQGGEYRLRLHAEDRARRPVAAEARLEVSGDGDAQKLRFLTDLTEVPVGAETELRLHNRAGPGLALVTFLGAGVLEHRVVHLAAGANALRFAVRSEFWPNFAVAVDLLREREWHSTQLSLRATHALRVVLRAEERWTPGAETEIGVEVTDALGRPVAAEFALGVVDEALLALYPDQAEALEAAFLEGSWRQAEMRSAATSTFTYAGATRFIAREILDEELARLAAAEWADRRAELVEELAATLEDATRGFRMKAPAAPAPSDELGQFGYSAGERKSAGRAGRSVFSRPGDSLPEGRMDAVEGGLEEALALWDARVRTDAQGRAVARFRVPERSTRWRVLARGVGPDNLLGEAQLSRLARADFFVELRAPTLLREGDAPTFGARVHSLAGGDVEVRMTLEVAADGRRWRVPATARLADGARAVEADFPLPEDFTLPPGGAVELAVTASGRIGGSEAQASARRTLRVLPWGSAHTAARAGELGSEESFTLELPPQADWRAVTVELQLHRGVDALLVQEAMGESGGGPRAILLPDLAAELLGACGALQHLEMAGRADGPDAARLRSRAEGLIAALSGGQSADGRWPWCAGAAPAAESTARGLWALCSARERGFAVAAPALASAVAAVQEALRRLPSHAHEETAMFLHALACAEAADFGIANRLHRARLEMNVAALAYATLALARMGSAPMAGETAAVLAERYVQGRGWSDDKVRGWHRDRIELSALALLALQASPLRTPVRDQAAADLLRLRPWPGPSARGLAVASLTAWRAGARLEDEDCEVEVEVGGAVRTQSLAAGAAVSVQEFPLPDGTARVVLRLALRGRGRPHFSATLRGFSRTLIPAEDRGFRITEQKLLAAPPAHGGREIPVGFGVLTRADEVWENEATAAPLGGIVLGRVSWSRSRDAQDEDLDADYLMLEVPLPAGARVVPGSVHGSVEAWEEREGSLIAWIGRTRHGGSLAFRLAGAHRGDWRTTPAVLRSAYDPARSATGKAGAFRVLARDAGSADAYRPTPDELFHLGQALFRDGDYASAAERLQALAERHERRLRDQPLRELAEMMLYVGIARDEPQRIVRWFEVLREKSPDLTIPFDRVVTVGRAYRALGEHERAARIFQAVLEETFGKDLRVAGVLDGQGDFAGATDALYRLWLEYPDLPVTVESALTLADRMLRRAPGAHLDPALARSGYDRAALTGGAVRVLRAFQSLYARDPLAADAGLDLVSAHLGLEDYATAAARAHEMAARFPAPRWADSFGYVEAVAAWYLGRDDDARALLQRIAKASYEGPDGSVAPSENRDLAIYILGQIHHARQDFEAAAAAYERIVTVFADAREALAAIREKRLELDEVATFRPGEPATLTLRHRNVAAVEILVYPVDLMTLYLRERNLASVADVHLAGIRPTLRRELVLAGGTPAHTQETALTLDLGEPGAYLVMARGDELHASGMVLISDVEIDVREDAAQGRLRVQAAMRGGGYLRDVDVRVVGSAGAGFAAGRTDPRGIFVADGILGSATVIARWQDQHYAFFRGERLLGLQEQDKGGLLGEPSRQLEAGDYLSNVMLFCEGQQQERAQNFERNVSKLRTGVQVLQVE